MEREILQQILDEVKSIKTDVADLKTDVAELKTEMVVLKDTQKSMEKKLDMVFEETANLMEFRTETIEKIDNLTEKMAAIENVTKDNLYDIAKLKHAR